MEYGAVILLVGGVVATVFSVGIPERVSNLYDTALCEVEGGIEGDDDCGTQPTGSTSEPPPEPGPDDNSQCLPLCEPVPGDVNLAEHPEPPSHPEDDIAAESSEEYDSLELDDVSKRDWRELWLRYELESKHRDARTWARLSWFKSGMDDARAALHHYLDGSGEPFDVDVDQMLDDIPEFQDEVDQTREDIGLQAIQEAQDQQSDLDTPKPMTFPVNSEWNAFGYNSDGTEYIYDNSNWINAMGSWNYNITGEVTVHPPEDPGSEWTYEIRATTNTQKYYDWDEDSTGPAVSFGPINASYSEQDLWNMHRTGLAQEFWMRGSSEMQTGP